MMPWSIACKTLELPFDHSLGDIKSAFRRAVRRTHPDQTGTSNSERAFILVVEAHERLTDYRHLPDHVQAPRKVPPCGRTWQEWLVILLKRLEAWHVHASEPYERYRFFRRDEGKSVYIKLVCRYKNRLGHGRSVTTFSFIEGEEPASYRELVRLHGEPIRVERRSRRTTRKSARDPHPQNDNGTSPSRKLMPGRH